MNCLSCQEPLISTGSDYHPKCCRKLFGRLLPPTISFSYLDIPAEAQKMVGRMSISGVQPKLSVAIRRGRLEVTASGGTHILKPTPEAFPFLSENENLCMCLARTAGDETPPHGLLKLHDGRLAYLIRRFDRDDDGRKVPVEDFAQLLGRGDKYNGSVEQIGKFLKIHSEVPYIDTQTLFMRVMLCFLIGNGDAHLKNFAMVRTSSGYQLAPAFDMVNSRLVLPSESDEMALTINGRRNRIDMRDFDSFSDFLEMTSKQRNNLISAVHRLATSVDEMVHRSFLPLEHQKGFLAIFNKRYRRLFPA